METGLKSDGSHGLMICSVPDDYNSCLPIVSVDLWYCGAVVATEVLVLIIMWIKMWTKIINN